jgi:hypothetical protein
MGGHWWAFNEDQVKDALTEWIARQQLEGKEPTSIEQAFYDFLNSPEALKHKMIGP